MSRHGLFLTISIGAACLTSGKAFPQPKEPFYKGKTVTLISGFTPGGSYDFYSRLLARHMGRHIPGQPLVVVQLLPGAGGLNAANFMARVAPRDGTHLGMLSQTLAIEEALAAPGIQYKAAEFNWIGRVSTSIEVTVAWRKTTADGKALKRSIEEARTAPITLASSGPGSALDSYPRVTAFASGLNLKIVTGYKGSTESLLAMERGEVDGAGTTWNTLKINRRDWLDQGKIDVVIQYARSRSPELPEIPAAVELGRTEDDRALLKFYMSGAEIGRAILTSPSVPGNRVDELRTAFDNAMKDPELLADIAKANAEFAPLKGSELQTLVSDTLAVRPELAERVKAALHVR